MCPYQGKMSVGNLSSQVEQDNVYRCPVSIATINTNRPGRLWSNLSPILALSAERWIVWKAQSGQSTSFLLWQIETLSTDRTGIIAVIGIDGIYHNADLDLYR